MANNVSLPCDKSDNSVHLGNRGLFQGVGKTFCILTYDRNFNKE